MQSKLKVMCPCFCPFAKFHLICAKNMGEDQSCLSGEVTCSELVTQIRNWVLPGGSKKANLCGSLNQVLFACPGHWWHRVSTLQQLSLCPREVHPNGLWRDHRIQAPVWQVWGVWRRQLQLHKSHGNLHQKEVLISVVNASCCANNNSAMCCLLSVSECSLLSGGEKNTLPVDYCSFQMCAAGS